MDRSAEDLQWDRLQAIRDATIEHQQQHGCGAVTFADGAGLIALAKDRKVLHAVELGTALGYTACCLASAGAATQVDTVEGDAEHVSLARRNIDALGLSGRINVHHGDFLQMLGGLRGPYDLAFFDGFAPRADIIEHLRDLLAGRGLLVCANLSLLDKRTRRELYDEMYCSSRWFPAGFVESGQTICFEKLG